MRDSRSAWTRLSSAASWVLVLASPLVFYVSVRQARALDGALFVLAFVALRAIPTLLATKREHLWAALRLPLVALVTAAVGVLTGEPRALLVLPSLSQAAFAGVFLASLRGVPLVEHFARMQKTSLRPEEVRYCRRVTIVWGVTLSAAALFGLALAAWAPIEIWTAFTAVGNYVLVGALFAIEYVYRKYRFREYGSMPVDRILSKLMPPPSSSSSASSNGVRDLGLDRLDDGRGAVAVPIPTDYVFFRGHFPKVAMLPGVVQLSEIVVPLVRRRHPELGALRQLRRIRFRRPILPGETVDVELGSIESVTSPDSPRSDIRFDLRVGDAVVASGTLSFEASRSGS